MNNNYDPEFVAQCRKEFDTADLNGDGYIDFEEFKAGTGCNEANIEVLRSVFDRFDTDGNGFMDFDEFCAMASLFKNTGDEEVIDEDSAAFAFIDKDHNGVITIDEFYEFAKISNPEICTNAEKLQATFNLFDANGDGFIDFDEFKRMTSATRDAMTNGEIDQDRASFAFIDKDGNGIITLKEFCDFLKLTNPDDAMTLEEVLDIFEEYDTNGDGGIDFEEFKQMMRQINEN